MIGQTISHYNILSKLGEGGMGVVYKAEDTKLDRIVALKFLPSHLTKSETDKARFLQEAKAASAINHPNVCVIHDIQEHDGQQFIVMEYVEGKTLREVVGSFDKTHMPLKDVIDTSVQIAEALKAAHEKGIVHRDIKSENIMVTETGQVKVMDFGLAKLRGSVKLTKSASTIGTIAYMSPEHIEGKDVDARTDIFSFGVVLYEMLTGTLPFKGEYDSAMMYAIVNEEPEPIRKYRPDLSSELLHVLHRALEKEPGARYQSIHDMFIELKRMKRDIETKGITQSETIPLKSSIKVGKIPILIGVILTIVMITIGVYLLLKGDNGDWDNTIVVLPFEDLSLQKDQEYFCIGMAEAISDRLNKIEVLRVINIQDKNIEKDIRKICLESGIDNLLKGTLQKDMNSIRVIPKLIKVADGSERWSDSYTLELENIFAFQDSVSRAIAEELEVEFSPQHLEPAIIVQSKSVEAYNLYLLGEYHKSKYTGIGRKKAIDYYQEALTIDPNYALAYVGLAETYVERALFSHEFNLKETTVKAKEEIKKALKLNDKLPEAYAVDGFIKCYLDWNWKEAEEAFIRGIHLSPNTYDLLAQYSVLLNITGRIDESIAKMRRALELDPLFVRGITDLGWWCVSSEQNEEAVEQFKKALEIDPNFASAHCGLGNTYLQMGLKEQGIKEIERGAELAPENITYRGYLSFAYARAGKKQEARRILAEMESLENPRKATACAIAYAGLNDDDRALQRLEDAYNGRHPEILWLYEPVFDSIRSHPGYIALLKKLDLAR